MLKRLFCLFSALAVLFFVSAPAFATGMTPGGIGGGVAGIPVVGEIQLDVVDFADYIVDNVVWWNNAIRHNINQDICPDAPTLNGGHSFVPRRTMKHGQIGKYYVCEYCGKAYGEALEEAYDEYVETLPGKTVYDDGSFLWALTPDACPSTGAIYVCDTYPYGSVRLDGSQRYSGSGFGYSVTGYAVPGERIAVSAVDLSYGSAQFCRIYSFTFTCPFDATYCLITGGFQSPPARFGSAGSSYALGKTVAGAPLNLAWPTFKVTPLELPSGFGSDTRVSAGDVSDSGTGSYGYVQDGQLYQSTVGTIYNETTNIYQNPVTGETKDVSNWTYDYSDRSYTLTTDEGDTVTVTYGDTNVTISDGGTTYNVYYLTEHDESVPEHYYTSSVTLAPTCTGTGVRTYTCDDCGDTYTEIIPATGHSYQSAVTMPPTCVNTGVKTFTCSVCGDSYTQSIPATGHTWTVTKTVPNQYDDETGELTQAGYTLYECSTCGEQYRINAASSGETLPSPSTGGTSIDTGNSGGEALTPDIDSRVGRGFLATIAHGLTEDLPEVLSLISEWFTTVPALYDGYSKFLAASFAWMPSDCVMLLTFSVGMVTVIAICRAMFRR